MYHSHTTAECGSLSGSERKELFTGLSSIYLGEEEGLQREAGGRQLLNPDPVIRPLSKQRAQPRSGTSSSNQHVGPPHPMVFQEQQGGSTSGDGDNSSGGGAGGRGGPEATLLNTLQPVPSQLLHVDYRGQEFAITWTREPRCPSAPPLW